jgi:hypothetical protein
MSTTVEKQNSTTLAWPEFKAKYDNKEPVPLSEEYQRILDGYTYEINGKKY